MNIDLPPLPALRDHTLNGRHDAMVADGSHPRRIGRGLSCWRWLGDAGRSSTGIRWRRMMRLPALRLSAKAGKRFPSRSSASDGMSWFRIRTGGCLAARSSFPNPAATGGSGQEAGCLVVRR
jgi:hypothetical protein